MSEQQEQIIKEIKEERLRQDRKWGEQNHDLFTWVAIITEEVGEFAQAALHHKFGGSQAAYVREEMIQTAAVALQIIEYLDRNNRIGIEEV